MKLKSKLLLFLILIVFLIGCIGCRSNKIYINETLKSLNSKYGLLFAVESIGGKYGTYDDTTVKMWCYATDGEFKGIKFMAEIGKEDLLVKDSYMNLIAAKSLSEMLKNKFPEKSIVVSNIETPGKYTDYKNMEGFYDLFLKNFDNYWITSFLFIKEKEGMTNSEYAQIIYNYGKTLENLKLKDLSIIIFVVKDLSDDIVEKYYAFDNERYDNFISDSNVVKYSGIHFDETGLLTNISDIENFAPRKVN